MADALKAEGNKAFAAKDYDRAIDLFSQGLDLDQTNFVLWSNRSAAKAGKRDWDGALADAEQVRYGLVAVCLSRAELSAGARSASR
jgi:stress-induced-phosphoprotein 1